MTEKEKKIQRALGTLPARHYLIVTIGAELEEDTPQHLLNKVDLCRGDTDDVELEDFNFPIKSKEDFFDQIIYMFTPRKM